MYKQFRLMNLWGAVFFNAEGAAGAGAAGAAGAEGVAGAAGAAGAEGATGGEPAQKLWYDDIAEEPVRELMKTKGYKSPAEAAMAYHNLNKLVSGTNGGADVVAVYPGENATTEQLDAFYKKLGRPDAPEGYAIKTPEGVTADEGMVSFAQKTFHAAGLSPKQADVVAEAWNNYVAERAQKDAAQFAADNAAELDQYKANFKGNFDEAVAAGKRVVEALGLEQDVLTKLEGAVGAKAMLEVFSKIGLKSSEGGFTAGAGGSGSGGGSVDAMTPQAATAEVNRLTGDAEFMKKYGDRNHPEHKDAVARMEALYKRAG